MKESSELNAIADAIEEVTKDIWNSEDNEGWRTVRDLGSPATKGQVLGLMELIADELRSSGGE